MNTGRLVAAIASVACALPSLSACAVDAGSTERSAVASTDEALLGPTCSVTSPANAVASGRRYYSGEIPAGYGSSACPGEWILEMDGATPVLGGPVNVTVAPWTAPSNAAACADTFASVSLWGWSPPEVLGRFIIGGHWVSLGSAQAYGTWSSGSGVEQGGCSLSTGALSVTSPAAYASYRVMAEVKQTNSFGVVRLTEPAAMQVWFEEPGVAQ